MVLRDMVFSLALIIIFFGTLGHVVFGFGGGLISIPPLSLIVGVQRGVTLSLVLQLVTGVLIWQLRHDLRWRVLRPMIGGLVIGTPLGIYFLCQANETFLRLFLASVILVYLVKSTFFDQASFPGLKRAGGGFGMGLAAGLLQGLIGSGGPPMVIYLRETIRGKAAMRAGLLFLLFISNGLRLPLSISAGLFDPMVLEISLAAIPCFALALFLGHRWHDKMSEKHYQLAIRLVLIVSAILLILKSV